MPIRICIEIQRPVKEVFVFISNTTNLPIYDKTILDVKKITEGPIGVGTTYHLTTNQFGIQMDVRQVLTAYEPSRHFTYRVDSGPFPVETHYTLESHEVGTKVCGSVRRIQVVYGSY